MSKRRANQTPTADSNNNNNNNNMASNSDNIAEPQVGSEQEPLLGRPGALQQKEDNKFLPNLIVGTGFLAQIGLLLLVASVWTSIFTHDVILFSAHPLLNSTGVLLLFQSALLLQPTHTAKQKKDGAGIHAALNGTALVLLFAGFGVILANKIKSGREHFHSPHAICGLIAYITIPATALAGNLMFFFPNLLGGEAAAKKLYKVHRVFGYVNLIFLLGIVISATKTEYVMNVLKLQTWQPALASALILVGLLPRIKKQKLGF